MKRVVEMVQVMIGVVIRGVRQMVVVMGIMQNHRNVLLN